ncbi:MAG TPA: molybdate ABC transporter permease subunit [Bryobacteraceae bacterium]
MTPIPQAIDWFPLWLSLRVAALATLFVLIVGTFLAFMLSHREFRGKNVLDALITLPLVLPPTVLGYYLLVLLGRPSPFGRFYEYVTGQPLVFTWEAAVVAACLHSTPIYVKAARAILEGIDYRYEWAAFSLGASEWRTFWHVTLPLARRGLVSLAALAFARSLGDFGVTIMLAGNIPGRTQTLSVAIYNAVESGNGHVARVLVLVISLIALALLWSAGYAVKGGTNGRFLPPASRARGGA